MKKVVYIVVGIALLVGFFVVTTADDEEELSQVDEEQSESIDHKKDNQEDGQDLEENKDEGDNEGEEESQESLDEIDPTFDVDEEDLGYDMSEEEYAEFDFEGIIIDRVGKKEYKKIMKKTEEAINLYIQGEKKGWEEISTEKFNDEIESGRFELLDTDKKMDYEVYPTEQSHEKDIITGAIINDEGNEESKSFTFIFVKEKDEYYIDAMVLMWEN